LSITVITQTYSHVNMTGPFNRFRVWHNQFMIAVNTASRLPASWTPLYPGTTSILRSVRVRRVRFKLDKERTLN
jgi:hypothetical protein